MKRLDISFAGSGKVAFSLARHFTALGHRILQVYSRSAVTGEELAGTFNAQYTDSPEFSSANDLVVVSVSDSALGEVLGSVTCSPATLVVHTAGSFGLGVFPPRLTRKGVFYPLQTFSAKRVSDMSGVAVLLESPDPDSLKLLGELAGSMGANPVISSEEQRRLLHVAGVFVSNFTNFMLTTGDSIASRAGFDPAILNPLIRETVGKALETGAAESQTGPAVRNDFNTIEKHLELLSFSPELQALYDTISRSIINYYK